MTTQTITVSGMTCGHCVGSVRDEVGRLDGVRDVDVQLDTGQVTITSDNEIDAQALSAAVEEAGYEVVS